MMKVFFDRGREGEVRDYAAQTHRLALGCDQAVAQPERSQTASKGRMTFGPGGGDAYFG